MDWSIVAGIAFVAGALWRDLHVWSLERRARRAACAHEWGPVLKVKNASRIRFPEAWVRFCKKCGLQLDCNEDGTEYVPRRG